MKKILMYSTGELFTENQTGGTKRFIELCKYLQSEFNADLCCEDSEEKLCSNGLNSGFRILEPQTNKFRLFPPEARILLFNRKLLKRIQKENYDLVFSFDVPPSIGLCLMGFKNLVLLIRKDLIGYENVKGNSGIKHKLKNLYLWLSEDICLKKSKVIITQCRYDKDQLISRHKRLSLLLEDKIKIQINNVNPSWIVDKSGAVKDVFQADNKFHVAFVGNFNDPRKGHDILLKAAEIVEKQGIEAVFDIVGAGRDFEKYKKLYESESIIFHGRLDNPIKILKQSGLCVVPSLADSCPNTVMESLYNEVPVIGSRAGGIPEILMNDIALFELEPEKLAEKIICLYQNNDLLLKLKAAERLREKELEFDWAEKISSAAGIN